jgi:hypothetical protein
MALGGLNSEGSDNDPSGSAYRSQYTAIAVQVVA